MIKKFILILTISILFQSVFVEAIKCLKCDSDTNPNCISDLSKITPDDCDKEDTLCLTSVDTNGKVTRSCSKTKCESDTNCKSSDKDSGNKHNICQTCTSDDPKCVQSESVVNSFNKPCEAEDTVCLVKIDGKKTERHCATKDDTNTCKNDDTCKTCKEANCNFGIFPTNRLRCFQCKDDKCNSVIANSDDIKPAPCQLYDSTDKCYMYATSATTVIRGCISDTNSDNKCSTPESNKLCHTCGDSNCNNQNYQHIQNLKCIQCTSTKTDDTCKWGQDVQEAKNCQKEIIYNQEEKCYTQTKDGDIVQRGCLHDRDSDQGECESGTHCTTCSDGNGCNNKDEMNFTCIRCRSDENGDCYNNADKISGGECRNPVTQDRSGCFRGKWHGVVIRGCLVDADERVEATCMVNDPKTCEYCLEKDCNKMKSSASSLNIFATLFVIGTALLVQQF